MKMKYETQPNWRSTLAQTRAISNQNKQVMGYVSYNKNDTSLNPCHIIELFVEDAYRNKGIGSTLLTVALLEQFKSGCDKVTLNVYNDTSRFFSKRGAQFDPSNEFGIFEDNYHTVPMEFRKPT